MSGGRLFYGAAFLETLTELGLNTPTKLHIDEGEVQSIGWERVISGSGSRRGLKLDRNKDHHWQIRAYAEQWGHMLLTLSGAAEEQPLVELARFAWILTGSTPPWSRS